MDKLNQNGNIKNINYLDKKEFENRINNLLSINNYIDVINECYNYMSTIKVFNFDVLNLLILSLINVKEFRIAKVFVEKFIELKKGDKNAVQNLTRLKNSLDNKKNPGSNNTGFKYLYELLKNSHSATVSLCMIVKNEEKNIKKCLESVKDIVSEIIIVDTGCTDKTVEIAKNYGSKILEFEWKDDFAAARNRSIKDATGDYILFLDADEYIGDESRTFFKNLKKPEVPHCYFTKIVNFVNREEDALNSVEHYNTRMWTNNPCFKFRGRIHENLIYDDSSFQPGTAFSGVTVYHTGYLQDEMERKNKFDRNLALLKKSIEENPDSSFDEYNLAIQYKNMGMLDEAVNHLKLMEVKINKDAKPVYQVFGISALASIYIQMGNYVQAAGAAKKALGLNSNLKEAKYNLGLAYYNLGKYREAITQLTEILKSKEPEVLIGGTIDASLRSWKTYNVIGICYIGLEDYKNAIKNLKKAFKINNYASETILNLISAYLKTGKTDEIINLTEKMGKLSYPVSIIEQVFAKLYSFNLKKHAIKFLKSQKSVVCANQEELGELESKFLLRADLYEAAYNYEKKKYIEADCFYTRYFNAINYSAALEEIIKSGGAGEISKWGHANLLLKNYLKAEEILENLLSAIKDQWNIYHNLATAKMSLLKMEEAIALFAKAKKLKPGSIETNLNLGKVYIYLKQYLKAYEALSYAYSLDKERENKEVVYYLANTLFFTGNYDEALKKAMQCHGYFGPDSECFYLAGLCHYKKQDYINAALYFSKALKVAGSNINYLVYLGNSLKKLEMFDEARLYYSDALQLDSNNLAAQAGYTSLMLAAPAVNYGQA